MAAPESDCVLAQWGDQVVVFHRPSGQTHFINSAMAQLLADLSGSSGELEALTDRFAGAHGLQDRALVRHHVLSLLLRLEELGLMERLRRANDG